MIGELDVEDWTPFYSSYSKLLISKKAALVQTGFWTLGTVGSAAVLFIKYKITDEVRHQTETTADWILLLQFTSFILYEPLITINVCIDLWYAKLAQSPWKNCQGTTNRNISFEKPWKIVEKRYRVEISGKLPNFCPTVQNVDQTEKADIFSPKLILWATLDTTLLLATGTFEVPRKNSAKTTESELSMNYLVLSPLSKSQRQSKQNRRIFCQNCLFFILDPYILSAESVFKCDGKHLGGI